MPVHQIPKRLCGCCFITVFHSVSFESSIALFAVSLGSIRFFLFECSWHFLSFARHFTKHDLRCLLMTGLPCLGDPQHKGVGVSEGSERRSPRELHGFPTFLLVVTMVTVCHFFGSGTSSHLCRMWKETRKRRRFVSIVKIATRFVSLSSWNLAYMPICHIMPICHMPICHIMPI